jgi:hypothetical protein
MQFEQDSRTKETAKSACLIYQGSFKICASRNVPVLNAYRSGRRVSEIKRHSWRLMGGYEAETLFCVIIFYEQNHFFKKLSLGSGGL